MKVTTSAGADVEVDVHIVRGRAFVGIETDGEIHWFDDAAAEQLELAVRAARIGANGINVGQPIVTTLRRGG